MLRVEHLSVARDEKTIFSDVSFSVSSGECIVIRGKNGVGKSSLLAAIIGMSDVRVTSGDIFLDETSILTQKTHERARSGFFLAHQEPPAIDGVTLAFMARASLEAIHGITDIPEAQRMIREAAETVGVPESFTQKMLLRL